MSLKIRRIHFSGISNLDFRTKGDQARVKFYQPYHESKPFGIQGLSNYKLPPSVHKKLFKPTRGINEGKFLKNEMPNPKIYETALFYRNNSMKIKPKVFLTVERSKQLDTSEFRGGEEYNGDSMMISEIMKKRNEIKERILKENIEKRMKANIHRDLAINKIKENNLSLSQRSVKTIKKSKSDIFLLDKNINKGRLNMIRNKIFNRLKTHDNIKGIFIKWQNDYLGHKELSIYDLHKIINDLGIKITYNEAQALISSANKRNTDKLNYDEFKDFFLNDDNLNKNIELNMETFPFQNEDVFEEKHKKEEENSINKFKDLTVEKSQDFVKLEKITRNNYPNFLQYLSKSKTNNNEKLDGTCDLPTFKNIIKTMKIPYKCKNDDIINSLFNKYKIEEKNLMNYDKFIEDCKNIKEENNFFHFQNEYLGLIRNKLEKNKEERKRYNEVLEENNKRRRNYLENQLADMKAHVRTNKSVINLFPKNIDFEINKEKKYFLENQNSNTINNKTEKDLKENEVKENYIEKDSNLKNKNIFYNHYQPSLDFINYVFKDNKRYSDQYYQYINEISPIFQSKDLSNNNTSNNNYTELSKIALEKELNSKIFKKNFLSDDINDDSKRFKVFELSKEEKENKQKYLENSLKRKFETNKKWNDKINFQQNIYDINNSIGQIKRTESLYKYEKKMRDMNNII